MDTHSLILCIPLFCFLALIPIIIIGVIYFARKKSETVTLPGIADIVEESLWEEEKSKTEIPVFELKNRTGTDKANIITEETEEDLSLLDKVEDEIPEDKIPTEQDIDWTIFEKELEKQDPVIDTLELEFEETDTESDEPIPRPLIKPTKRDRTSSLKKAEDLLTKHFPLINRIKEFKFKLI